MRIVVVIPVFNEEQFIGKCLEALTKQTRQPDGIFIVDNNSTDKTAAIAATFHSVTIIDEPLQGICAATYRGLSEAAKGGGIILRCDADCIPPLDWVERVAHLFQESPSIKAVTGPGRVYGTNKIVSFFVDTLYMKPYFYVTASALGYKPLFGSNFAIRADTWRAIAKHTHLQKYQNIHDDMDISFHLKGGIRYEPSLIMPMSVRPFRSPRSLPKRFSMGLRSVYIHWPEQAPWKRFAKNRH